MITAIAYYINCRSDMDDAIKLLVGGITLYLDIMVCILAWEIIV